MPHKPPVQPLPATYILLPPKIPERVMDKLQDIWLQAKEQPDELKTEGKSGI